MKQCCVLRTDRLRCVPKRFSWIDHRLIREGHAQRCGVTDLALYLVLITVGDRNGVSFYSDRALCRILGIMNGEVTAARQRLLKLDLIAWQEPFYQVLSLGNVSASTVDAKDNSAFSEVPATPEQIRKLVKQFSQRNR